MRISSIPSHSLRFLLGTSALAGVVALVSTAEAGQPGLPTGGVVMVGSGVIAPPSADWLDITPATGRTVIDWRSVPVGAATQSHRDIDTSGRATCAAGTGPTTTRLQSSLPPGLSPDIRALPSAGGSPILFWQETAPPDSPA